MEHPSLYRKKSIDRIQSPEQLNDYLRVTNPAVWVLMTAVIVLLVGTLIWGSSTYIGSSVSGVARVENGLMTVTFEDETLAKNVQAGMYVTVGDTRSAITSVGYSPDGTPFAQADTGLADGEYDARVNYRQTQIIELLFN
jgi:hypothetical protein